MHKTCNTVKTIEWPERTEMARYTGEWSTIPLVCYLCLQAVTAWWLLDMPSIHRSTLEMTPANFRENCLKLHYLMPEQKELCSLSYNILEIIGTGARMSIAECQYQFRMKRWNCSTHISTSTVFGDVVEIKSREKAFIYAISSAAIAYSITQTCSRGEVPACGCDEKIRSKNVKKNWEWAGCSDDVHFGCVFSKKFVDSKENKSGAAGLMNLHNNEAGRRILRSNMQLVCKCHGVSGSCAMKVCWRKMASFREIGDYLRVRFEGATRMKFSKQKGKLKTFQKGIKRPTKKDLIYLDDSPDYCEPNEKLGVPGTKGRLCNRTSYDINGCSLMCCGRGYQTSLIEVTEKCNCQFVWCCKVICENCSHTVEQYNCN